MAGASGRRGGSRPPGARVGAPSRPALPPKSVCSAWAALSSRLPPLAPPFRALARARRSSGLRWALPGGFPAARPAPAIARPPRPSLGGLAARCPPGLPPRCGAPAAPVPSSRALAAGLPCGALRASSGRPGPSPGAPLRPPGRAGRRRPAPRFGPARCGGPLRRCAPCPRSSRAGAVRACGPPCVAPRPRVSGVGVFRPLRRAASPAPRPYSIQTNGPAPASPHSPPIQQNGYIFC